MRAFLNILCLLFLATAAQGSNLAGFKRALEASSRRLLSANSRNLLSTNHTPVPISHAQSEESCSCEDLICHPTHLSQRFWEKNYPTIVLQGTYVGRGVIYAVSSDPIVFTAETYADVTVKIFYDPGCGCGVTQTWLRPVNLVNGSVSPYGVGNTTGASVGVFNVYAQRDSSCPNSLCLTSDVASGLQQYYTEVQVYGDSLQTNTYINKTTGRVYQHEVSRYPSSSVPVNKIVTNFQIYDDSTNSMVEYSAFDFCFVTSVVNGFDPTTETVWPALCGVIN